MSTKHYHHLSFEEKRERVAMRPHTFRCQHCDMELTARDCAAHVARCPRRHQKGISR
jgi:hypothetical protein